MIPASNLIKSQDQNPSYIFPNDQFSHFSGSLKDQNSDINNNDSFFYNNFFENSIQFTDFYQNFLYKHSHMDSSILAEVKQFHHNCNISYWTNLILPLEEKEYLLMTIKNLSNNLEYENEKTRKNYIAKVQSLLKSLENNNSILYYILQEIEEKYKDYFNKPFLSLYNLKFISISYQAVDEKWGFRKLLDMGKRIFRLAVLHRIAKKDLADIKKKLNKHAYYLKNKHPLHDADFYLAYQAIAIERGINLPVNIPKIYKTHFYVLEHKVRATIDQLKKLDFYDEDGYWSKDFCSCISSFWKPLKEYVEINHHKSIDQMKK